MVYLTKDQLNKKTLEISSSVEKEELEKIYKSFYEYLNDLFIKSINGNKKAQKELKSFCKEHKLDYAEVIAKFKQLKQLEAKVLINQIKS